MMNTPTDKQTSNVTSKKEVKTQKKRRSFSIQEDCYLAQAVQKYGEKAWDKVATMVPTRNARQCKERWMSYLSPSLINGPWTKEEDDLLFKLCVTYGKHWTCLTKFFKGRSDNNLKNRWYSVLQHRVSQYQQQSSPNITYQNSPQLVSTAQITFPQQFTIQPQQFNIVSINPQQDSFINLEPQIEQNISVNQIIEQVNDYQFDDVNSLDIYLNEPYIEAETFCEF